MPLVAHASSFARDAEGLAGTGAGPDGEVVGPAGEFEGEGPAADAGEEVGSLESFEVFRLDIYDAPLIDQSTLEMASNLKFTKPRRHGWVVVVVVHIHSIGLTRLIFSLNSTTCAYLSVIEEDE